MVVFVEYNGEIKKFESTDADYLRAAVIEYCMRCDPYKMLEVFVAKSMRPVVRQNFGANVKVNRLEEMNRLDSYLREGLHNG